MSWSIEKAQVLMSSWSRAAAAFALRNFGGRGEEGFIRHGEVPSFRARATHLECHWNQSRISKLSGAFWVAEKTSLAPGTASIIITTVLIFKKDCGDVKKWSSDIIWRIARHGETTLRRNLAHRFSPASFRFRFTSLLGAFPRRPDAMVLKIRLARFGRRNAPFYNIVVAHARYAPPSPPPRPARVG